MNFARWALILLLLFPFLAQAQKTYTYVGRIGTDSALLAWGTTGGNGNTIGRASVSLGKATVRLGDREISSEENWVLVRGLLPDTAYSYEVTLGNKRIGEGAVRTYPEKSKKLVFFVLGDYGTGKPPQYEIAEAMWREFERRSRSDNPVRFVLTTGDNIYSNQILGFLPTNSGDEDRDWGPKFFEPYERLLRHIPFYPTLGNHDTKESESEGDLSVYLDNFFFPILEPARSYAFSFGGLAEFFALDTTEGGLRRLEQGRQFQWLQNSLRAARAPWKIAYFHHPLFNAGPGHGPVRGPLRHIVDLFQETGVRVAFSGHEHNFQYSERNGKTGNVLYVITGAGGKLRRKDIRDNMQEANIAGWAPQTHFLLVEIEDRTLQITPLASEPVIVRDKDSNSILMPLVIRVSERDAGSHELVPRQESSRSNQYPAWRRNYLAGVFDFRLEGRVSRHE